MELILLILCSYLLYYEFAYLINKQPNIIIKAKSWKHTKYSASVNIEGKILMSNPHKRKEIMIPEFKLYPKILGSKRFKKLKIKTISVLNHPDLPSRKDDYWQAFIIKSRSTIEIDVKISISDKRSSEELINDIENLWLDIKWINYGPFGKEFMRNGFAIPINYPSNDIIIKNRTGNKNHINIPIKTHMLGILDDPYELIYKYIKTIKSPGDIVTIGETPLSIMQGRYIHPNNIKPTLLARLLCYFFHPTSSLATGCGMQTLINEAGPIRVFIAWLIGSIFKLFKVKGMFYRLAGIQASLIDDITGTTPPYDQYIILGPTKAQEYCDRLAKELEIDIAVVDVNDLGKVKILAANQKANLKLINNALRSNPAGNADQHTPIVIVRPLYN